MKRAVVLLLALLALGAGPYRWVDEEGRVHYSDVPPKGVLPKVEPPQPPAEITPAQAAPRPSSAAITTLNTYVLFDAAKVAFRLAIAVGVEGGEDAEVEAEFENPAQGGPPLPGARMEKAGSRKDQFMMMSPWVGSIECRAYQVTLRVYRGGDRGSPVATKSDSIVSHMDSSAVAAGGVDAAARLERGERVCPG